ncbi:Splicing factor U2AF 26 kDa subunit [Clydaea vesicula]|uniref:Splicing factor U2AF 26 kDa subunit n=1 Tax=Clydaea vesicula TaxID=447962 RepID=A0AAD5Y1A8_9FUNG|nr:Splicing factor U2AF 26 kDa subunit [Clydaea vesicula]
MGNVYQNPMYITVPVSYTNEQLQEHFDLFFEDLFIELAKFGEIEELNVCDNVGDHLVGNVYIRFRYEEDAQKASENLNDRFYAGKPLYCELSPVMDFKESCCRQYDNGDCTRGGFCNFMHLKKVSKHLKRELFDSQKKYLKIKRQKEEANKRLEKDKLRVSECQGVVKEKRCNDKNRKYSNLEMRNSLSQSDGDVNEREHDKRRKYS